MVMGAVAVLSLLVTELIYTTHVSQQIAYDGMDRVQAHYMAKSALKFSLLRLKAYQQVTKLIGGGGGAGGGSAGGGGAGGGNPLAGAIPKSVIEGFWSMPISFPIPTNIPGMPPGALEAINKFQTESALPGSFVANIESESQRYNLNSFLANFQPAPNPSPSASATPPPAGSPPATPGAFDADAARNAFGEYVGQIWQNKVDADPEFSDDHKDFRLTDFLDNIFAWADPSYQRRNSGSHDPIPLKKAPFYSIEEMHMVPGVEDSIYDLFAPGMTVALTPGLNVNKINEQVLKSIVPLITKEESAEFIKFRDSDTEDNLFKTPDDFYAYLQKNTGAYRDQRAIDQLKADLTKKNIRLITDEQIFRITVTGTMNNSTVTIQAIVMLGVGNPAPPPGAAPTQPQTPPGAPPPLSGPGQPPGGPQSAQDPGLRIIYMRFL
ncbi:MAG: hypothetical protein ACXWP5_14125 [Bdellovibrionota bacterium]